MHRAAWDLRDQRWPFSIEWNVSYRNAIAFPESRERERVGVKKSGKIRQTSVRGVRAPWTREREKTREREREIHQGKKATRWQSAGKSSMVRLSICRSIYTRCTAGKYGDLFSCRFSIRTWKWESTRDSVNIPRSGVGLFFPPYFFFFSSFLPRLFVKQIYGSFIGLGYSRGIEGLHFRRQHFSFAFYFYFTDGFHKRGCTSPPKINPFARV